MKSAQSSTEDERFWIDPVGRDPRVALLLFGNPAIPVDGIRGFASPDCSGFALSEIFLQLKIRLFLILP